MNNLKKIFKAKFKFLKSVETLKTFVMLLFVFGNTLLLFTYKPFNEQIRWMIFIISILALIFIIDLINEYQKVKTQFPVVGKRFTYKHDDTGAVTIRKADMEQAILYLYEIENYLNK